MSQASPSPDEWAESGLNPGKAEVEPGVLYLVGTRIGNLGDLSPRAAGILAGVDLVAAEDTRRTLRLLNHFGISKRLESYHEHNRQAKGPLLLDMLLQGRSIALVTDSGMPCISDPGAELVRLCVERSLPVRVIPGPCAAIAGLAASGLLTDRFVFEAFLPVGGKNRKQRLLELAVERRTIVLYEAPHKLRKTLADLAGGGLGQRLLTLARELTKLHEEYLRLTVDAAADYYEARDPRGEYVLVLEGLDAWNQRQPQQESAGRAGVPAGKPAGNAAVGVAALADDASADPAIALLHRLLAQGLTVKDAARQCAQTLGRKKNEIYQLALAIRLDSRP